MAYPRQINPAVTNPPPPEGQTSRPARPVAFTASNIYDILYQGSNPNFYLAARKSTAAGDETPWPEKDSANHPAVNRSTYGECRVHRNGNKIYCTYAAGHTFPPSMVAVKAFDMSADTWGTETPATNAPIPDDPSSVNASPINLRGQWASVVRSNGDICTLYIDVSTGYVGGQTLYGIRMKKCISGTWQSTALDVLVPDSDHAFNYELLDVLIGGDGDRIHVFAQATGQGYFHAVIDASDTVRSQFLPMIPVTAVLGNDRGRWGQPILATIGSTVYAALPTAFWVDNEGSPPSGNRPQWKPGVILFEDTDAMAPAAIHAMEEIVHVAANYISVNVDSYDGALFLIWTKAEYSTKVTSLRMSCFRGFAWSAPSTVYGPTASGELIEWHEIAIGDGILHLVLENLNGDSPYLYPHYSQGAISCSATGCPAGGSSRIRRFG
jgi:hypothetical protein